MIRGEAAGASDHHGAIFIVVGALTGIALVIHELWCDRAPLEPAFEPAP